MIEVNDDECQELNPACMHIGSNETARFNEISVSRSSQRQMIQFKIKQFTVKQYIWEYRRTGFFVTAIASSYTIAILKIFSFQGASDWTEIFVVQDVPIIFLMQFSKYILNEYTTVQMFATFFFLRN